MSSPFWIVFSRTILFYFTLLAAVRLMGKRELASLSPADLVVAILLAEMAIIPIESPDVPAWYGILPIAVIALLQIVLSYASLKSRRAQEVVDGTPSILIRGGKIDAAALRANRYSLEELMSQLRVKGAFDLADVEFAVLENNGELSVLLKSQKRPLTPADLGIATRYEGLPRVLILDGQVMREALEELNLDEVWLAGELARRGVNGGPESVLVATLNTQGELYFQAKDP